MSPVNHFGGIPINPWPGPPLRTLRPTALQPCAVLAANYLHLGCVSWFVLPFRDQSRSIYTAGCCFFFGARAVYMDILWAPINIHNTK